jgi:hypothetical protein
MIEEDRLDPATGEIRPQKGGAISVFTDMIADVEGVKAGSPLSAINIKKLCQSGEGTTSCQAPYSEFVEYGLSETDSMKSIATLRKKGSKAKIAYIKIGLPF